MVKGIFQPMECHAQYVNWGELAGRHRSLLRDGLGIDQWAISICVVHHLSFLGFIPLFSFPLLLVIIIIYCFSIFFVQLQNCSYLKVTLEVCFPILLPIRARGRWVRGCVRPSCQLELNHGSVQRESFINRTLKRYIWIKSHPAYLPNFTSCFPKDMENQIDSKPVVFIWISGLFF